MTHKIKVPQQQPEQPYPSNLEKENTKKIKSEQTEIAGRHKNIGQKDHKGAR